MALGAVGCGLKCGVPVQSPVSASLMSEVRTQLGQRDAKLQSYSVESEAQAQGAKAKYRFWYRAPQRMRGEITEPNAMAISFDGKKLYQLNPAEKSLTVFEMKVSKEKAALVLTQSFTPFVAEGYRVPLFPNTSTQAQKTTHAKAVDAVSLSVATADEQGKPISVEYVLRWPSMDFLSKTTRVDGKSVELRVDEEKCDEKLKLCVPQAISEWQDAAAVGSTRFTRIELNSPLPDDDFALTAPAGFTTTARELVDSP
jgi:outer membrane lipoprotein-sorting protein